MSKITTQSNRETIVLQNAADTALLIKSAASQTADVVQIMNSDGTVKYFIINNNGNIGIGVTPSVKFHVSGNIQFDSSSITINATTSDSPIYINTDGQSSANVINTAYSSSSTPTGGGLVVRSARGSQTSPTATLKNDWLGFVGGRGHNGTAFFSGSQANIYFMASENFTSTAAGTEIRFTTTGNGTTSRYDRMVITNDGKVGINDTNPAEMLTVSGNIKATGTAEIGGRKDWGRVAALPSSGMVGGDRCYLITDDMEYFYVKKSDGNMGWLSPFQYI